MANQDKTSRQIAALRAQITELQEELLAYRTVSLIYDSSSVFIIFVKSMLI